MKEKAKSRDSKLGSVLAASILLCVGFASTTPAFAQNRLNRPPSGRILEGTPILAAGTAAIPDGTVLIIEMDTKLNSGTAQVSDRFWARLATPVIDANGRTLLQTGTIVEGHVTSVKKARWGHRSGELGLSFDFIEVGNGRRIPLRATLIGGSNPIDEEGNLKAKSATRRDALVTTGGAVAGAGVGMVTGASILVGGGAGAAAGLTAVLVMKGKNVDIDPGERFNLQLVQPLSLASAGYYGDYYGRGTGGTPASRRPKITRPVRLQPGAGAYTPSPAPPPDPNSIRTPWSRVPIYDVRAERDRDGTLRVLVTAETPTNGWRIYTHHEVQPRDTLDVRLMGVPPSQYGVRQISHPSAPPICVEDRNSQIRRIIVRGQNGARYLTIGQGATSAQVDSNARPSQSTQRPPTPRPSQPRPPRPRPSEYVPPAAPSTGNLPLLANQTANQIEVVRSNYAAAVGLWINSDGTVESFGARRATANEMQLYDTLSFLLTTARSLSAPSLDAYTRQRAGQQLRADIQTAQQSWQRVRSTGVISPDLDRQWQNALVNLRSLSNLAAR